MKYLITFTLIIQIYIANFGLLTQAEETEGYGYGPTYEDEDYVEEVELDDETIKKAIGSALGIALPVVLGTVGGAIVKKLVFGGPLKPHELLKPWKLPFRGPFGIFGILGPLSPFNLKNPLNPVNPIITLLKAVGLARLGQLIIDPNRNELILPELGLPPIIPGIGNAEPIFPRPGGIVKDTPIGTFILNLKKRSIDPKDNENPDNLKVVGLEIMMLFDKETMCIPKMFCSVMAVQRDDQKPQTKLEVDVKEFIDLYTKGNRKALVKKAHENVILYGSALGYITKSVTECANVFSKCPRDMNDLLKPDEE